MSYETKIEESEYQLKIYREGDFDEEINSTFIEDSGAFIYLNKWKKGHKRITAFFGYKSYRGNKEYARHLKMDVEEIIQLRNYLNKCLDSYIEE